MARSIGPKLFWASPNCFGHGSKCKIQYEKDFLVRSKTNWTWLGLGIEANFFQVTFFYEIIFLPEQLLSSQEGRA